MARGIDDFQRKAMLLTNISRFVRHALWSAEMTSGFTFRVYKASEKDADHPNFRQAHELSAVTGHASDGPGLV